MTHYQGKGIYLSLAAVLGLVTEAHHEFFIVLVFMNLVLWVKAPRIILLFNLIFFVMLFHLFWLEEEKPPILDMKQSVFSGQILSIPKTDGDTLQVTFLQLPEKVKLIVNLKLNTLQEKEELSEKVKPGLTCTVIGQVQVPQDKANFHGFDYQNYLKRQKIFYLIKSSSMRCQERSSSFIDQLTRLRQAGIQLIVKNYPPEVSGLVNALIFGDEDELPNDILTAYQNLGLIHLLAVSGLHISLVTAFLFYLLIRIGLTREKARIVLFILIPCYILLTGNAASVVRAGLMALLLLLSEWRNIKLMPSDTLSFVFLLMLIFKPFYLYDVGFQLSFAVTYGLVLSYPTLSKRFKGLRQLFATSVIAELCALPILLYTFYSFSVIGVFLNLLFIPLITLLVLPLSFFSFILLLLVPQLSVIFIFILKVVIVDAHTLLTWLNSKSISSINLGQPSIFMLFLLVGFLFFGFVYWEINSSYRSLLVPFVCLSGILILQLLLPYISFYGKVTFLNVGQGDSILIELPHRAAVYLIDTGGNPLQVQTMETWRQKKQAYRVGRDVVLHELKAKGIHHIDKLILTHKDLDHVGGMEDLIGSIPIREIVINPHFQPSAFEQTLFLKAERLGTKIKTVREGDAWKVGENRFYVLNPIGTENIGNDLSIVVYALLGKTHYLFTGDMESTAEARLIKNYGPLPVDVLKAGHHGSKFSSSDAFLDNIKPHLAIISVGLNNRYGHPNQEVLTRLNTRHIPILRTDQVGAIQMTFTNNRNGVDIVTVKKLEKLGLH